MEQSELIPVTEFCSLYHVETSFIEHLADYDLLEIKIVHQAMFFSTDDLPEVEKYVRLHRDLNISPEELHTIVQLLHKLKLTEEKVRALKNRLAFYESVD